jgi:hypothetical protein
MKFLALMFLFLLSLLNCAPIIPEQPIVMTNVSTYIHCQVFIDPAFPEKTIPFIKQAFLDWQDKLRVIDFQFTIKLYDCVEEPHAICIQPATPAQLKGRAGYTNNYGRYNALIKLSTDNYDDPNLINWKDVTRITTTHEVGHALGLLHDSHEGTVMYWHGSRMARHLTQRDINQFFERHSK